MNIVLIGFMGTGKSTIGRKLAAKLGMEFYDTDQDIEEVTGMTIPQLFKKHGEIRFRSEEAAAVKRAMRKDGRVIATGGGVVLNPDNVAVLKQNSFMVCLTADKDTIYERVRRKKNRPLLHGDMQKNIERLLKEREPYYQVADIYIDTSACSVEEVEQQIIEAFKAGQER
ncbi:shikimate kinase [Thermincola ferriacetica]|uniref:Shikimate kinase n=1 Tax=Thermincola ferriacetica TaxID=281456 RepID=A0A0L6W6F5_9FIRM|nr:shikimate kinase [Thermincola ferriacetica]KNZ70694.1 shikimate kinase [Thermincola ferriacetica]